MVCFEIFEVLMYFMLNAGGQSHLNPSGPLMWSNGENSGDTVWIVQNSNHTAYCLSG